MSAEPSAAARTNAARAEIRALVGRPGHAVDNAREALARLDAAFAAGDLERTPFLDGARGDLAAALDQADGQRLGGKSAEAARFILRAIDHALDEA